MSLPDDNPWRATETLDQYDVGLVLDHPVPWVPALEQPDPDAFVAWVGSDPVESRIPLHEIAAPTRTVAAAAAFLRALLDRLDTGTGPGDHGRVRHRLAHPPVQPLPAPAAFTGPPTPQSVAAALAEHLRPDDLLTWEVCDTAKIPRTVPGTLFEKGGSSLGWSVAAATGARLASGDTPAVALTGDGSYLFGSPDSCLWLQQQYDVPVLTVIINNGGYRTGTTTLRNHYPEGTAASADTIAGGHLTPSPDFAAQALSQGAHGERVEQAADLVPALQRARTAVERDRLPAVLDVWVPEHVTASMAPDRRRRQQAREGARHG